MAVAKSSTPFPHSMVLRTGGTLEEVCPFLGKHLSPSPNPTVHKLNAKAIGKFT